MIRNYLKIAWRSILKNRAIFSINVFGLSLGIASCLIIALFVFDELSYDRYNEKAGQIYRVVTKANLQGEDVREAVVMPPVAETLKREFPEVLDATRMRRFGEPNVIIKDETFKNTKFVYADPNFFEVFTLPIIEGEARPLDNPNTVVLTKTEAERYFGHIKRALGKSLELEGHEQPYTVTAVIEDIPRKSHFHFDAFLSMKGDGLAQNGTWLNSSFFTYLVLEKGYDPKQLESKLPKVLERNMGPQMLPALGFSYAEFSKENTFGLFLQSLTDIHLNPEFSKASTLEEGGDIKYVYIFSAVALFMLLIACINFINLSTAAASKRAKEVGIRKVLGSGKKQLVNQFLTESFIATTLAMLIAWALVSTTLPFFNQLSQKELDWQSLISPSLIVILLCSILVISFLSGLYPAFVLSSFKPVSALKSKFLGQGKSKGIRSGLVVFQFIISVILIFSVLVVDQQMRYIQNKNIGYDRDQILVLRDSYRLGNNNQVLKEELLKNPNVAGISQSAFVPAGPSDNSMYTIYMDGQFKRRSRRYDVDENYLPVMGMTLLEGRNFSMDFGSEKNKVIINQSAAKELGLGQDPIGKTFEVGGLNEATQKFTVIGVVKDFNYASLHHAVEPLFMTYKPNGGLIIKAKTGAMERVIGDIKTVWDGFKTDEVFSYTLLDNSYRHTYLAEQRMGTVLNVFALLTILVACLGLLGLVTFTAEQRIKEIGIRKVLGSTVGQVVAMLSKDFLKLVGGSFLVAFPIGYYMMDKWLQEFAYRINMQWWLFVLAGLLTLLIAFATMGWKSIKAAKSNPVKSLRIE